MVATPGRPVISCILPVHNAELWLADAIGSVLAQTERRFELIVVDDGSADGSLDIARRMATVDPRIIIIRQENRGVAAALNTGLAAARAPHIARMDADDISVPTRFARQLAVLEADKSVVIVGARARTIDASHAYNPQEPRVLPMGASPPLKVGRNRVLTFPPRLLQVLHPTIMFRASAMRSIGGYSEQRKYVEDYDFYLKAARLGKIVEIEEELLLYRIHGGNISIRSLQEQERNAAACDVACVQAFRAASGLKPLRIPQATQEGWTAFRCFRRQTNLGAGSFSALAQAVRHTLAGASSASPRVTLGILARCGLYGVRHLSHLRRAPRLRTPPSPTLSEPGAPPPPHAPVSQRQRKP